MNTPVLHHPVSVKSAKFLLGGIVSLGLLSAPSQAALTAYRNAVIADGAIAYYEFEETVGTTISDSAGGDNNGTIVGGVGLNQTGGPIGLGRSSSYNGTDARVRIPDNAIFDLGTGAFSVEVWYRANVTTRGDLITYKGSGGDFGIHSGSQSANTTSLYHNTYRIQNAPVNPAGGAWNHLVAVRTGGNISMYVNGVLSQTVADGDSMNITNDLLIGTNHMGSPDNPTLLFNGLIDEVAIYPSALSAAQVANHFALASAPEPGAAGLLALAGVAGLRRRRKVISEEAR
ncbi:MAG TPA: LamG domain-containing protein [Verrucomicrobiales bacterium]|nr:LamG domain-containing protein [Verrucomicrobiales bacterium]